VACDRIVVEAGRHYPGVLGAVSDVYFVEPTFC